MIAPYRWLIAAAVIAAAGFAAGYQVNGWRLTADIDRLKAAHARSYADAINDAAVKAAMMQRKKDEAIEEARLLAKANAAAADVARLERDRLRDQLATARNQLSTASCASVRNYASTVSAVLGECVGEYQALAGKADGHAADSRALISAWPRE